MKRIIPLVFLVATGFGVWLRLGLAGIPTGVPFDHLLHAHSHALYFGWAGLAVLVAAGTGRRWLIWGAGLLVPMTAAFLAQGYGPVSIAASAAVMAVWYGATFTVWRGTRPVFRWSLAYVIVASFGVLVLGFLQATDSGTQLARSLAVHAFLSTFAWSLVLGTLGVLARREALDGRTTRLVTWSIGGSAWLLFPLGVAGGPEFPGLGPISRVAAFVTFVGVAALARAVWQRHRSALRAAVAWLVVAAAGLVAVGIGGSAIHSTTGRAGVVIYLHALLLGYVSTVLVWGLAEGRPIELPLLAHQAGVAIMLAGVALPWLTGGRTGPILAAVGAVVVWVAALGWVRPVWRPA